MASGAVPTPKAKTKYAQREDYELMRLYKFRASLTTMARKIGRSKRSVETRIKRLIDSGRLEQRNWEPDFSKILITRADQAWMAYWSQPRWARIQQESRYGA